MNLFSVGNLRAHKNSAVFEISLFKIHALSREQKLIRQSEALRRDARRADERERPNLKSHLPAVIITSHITAARRRTATVSYFTIRMTIHEILQDTSHNSRRSKGVLISGTQDGKQCLLFHFPFHSLCFYLTNAFSPPFRPPVEQRASPCTTVYARVYVSCRYISGTWNITIPLASSILSDFSLIFWKEENEHESRALCVCEQRLRESLL